MVLLAPNLARPRAAAPPGSSNRPARGMSGFSIRQVLFITGHSLHEKNLQRQKGVVSLVGSQEQRALSRPADKTVINR